MSPLGYVGDNRTCSTQGLHGWFFTGGADAVPRDIALRGQFGRVFYQPIFWLQVRSSFS